MKIDRFELEDIEFKYQRLSKVLECIQMAEVEGSGLTDHCLEYALYDVIEGMWDNNKRLKKIVDEVVNSRSGRQYESDHFGECNEMVPVVNNRSGQQEAAPL